MRLENVDMARNQEDNSCVVRRAPTKVDTDDQLGRRLRSYAPTGGRAGGADTVVARMLQLQSSAGNRAVGEMLRARGASAKAPAPSLWKTAMRGVSPAISGTLNDGAGAGLREAGGGIAIGEGGGEDGPGLTWEEADSQIAAREGPAASAVAAPRAAALVAEQEQPATTAQRHGIDGAGTPHAGPLPADPSRPTVRRGSKVPAVFDLQTQLNALAVAPPLAVDGDFGSKTSTAVIAFQSSHPPLVADGIVGPATWGAFSAHTAPQPIPPLPGPVPPIPIPPLPGGPLTITSRTDMHAPDGTPDTRRTVAMGEVVFFSVGGAAVNWSATAGFPLQRLGRTEYAWELATPGPATITATDPVTGQTTSVDMIVVAPSSLRMVKQSEPAAAPAGADMIQSPRFGARSVNFGNCEWLEVSDNTAAAGAPTGITGTYFQPLIAAGVNLNHIPTPNFLRIGPNLTDEAGISGLPAPFSAGSFFWNIPNRFRRAATTGAGTVFVNSTQHFSIDATGRVTVSKQGASVTKP